MIMTANLPITQDAAPKTVTHAPGPWRVANHDGGWLTVVDPESFSDVTGICTIYGDSPEDQANAQLIASAPFLLQALQSIADVPSTSAGDGRAVAQIREIAFKSIELATGGAA